MHLKQALQGFIHKKMLVEMKMATMESVISSNIEFYHHDFNLARKA